MTVSYTFPENAGFANPAHSDATPCVVRRERAGQVSVSWLGADAGHECAVNEQTLRALARDPGAARSGTPARFSTDENCLCFQRFQRRVVVDRQLAN